MTDQTPPPAEERPIEPEKSADKPLEVRAEPFDPARESGGRTVDAPQPKSPPSQPATPPPQSPSGSASSGPASQTSSTGAGSSTPPPPRPTPSSPAPKSSSGWAVFCHLATLIDFCIPWFFIAWVPPLVIWLAKKDSDPEIDHHGRESLNFQLNLIFWALASFPLICVCGLGIVIMAVLPFVKLVMVLIASIRAADGVRFRYPFIFRIL